MRTHLSLLISSLLCAAPAFAENAASLSSNFRLSIPELEYHSPQGERLRLWAELQATPTTNALSFEVQDFGLIENQGDSEISLQAVRDLRSVTVDAPPQIVGVSHQDARLEFVSSIPLACVVVYGKTLDFGQAASDPNMNGAAIVEHHPVLSGLEPDTLYYYRVQGSAPDGTFYQGELGQFRTTPISQANNNNVAALSSGARVVAVSSNFGNTSNDLTWGANSAIDGSNHTAWSSNGDGDNAFITITFAETRAVKRVSVWSRDMSDGTARIVQFALQGDDGHNLGPFELPDAEQAYSFDVAMNTRTLRFDVVSSTGGNTGLVELAAFE